MLLLLLFKYFGRTTFWRRHSGLKEIVIWLIDQTIISCSHRHKLGFWHENTVCLHQSLGVKCLCCETVKDPQLVLSQITVTRKYFITATFMNWVWSQKHQQKYLISHHILITIWTKYHKNKCKNTLNNQNWEHKAL